MASPAPAPRSWNPEFKHSDRERWICVYPSYINKKKTVGEGRRVAKEMAVDNPTYSEMRDVCAHAGLTIGVENKVHPREREPRDLKYRGRIRVQLRNDDGSAMLEHFPTRKAVLLHLCEMIPKLKNRTSGGGQAAAQSSSAQPAASASSGGGGGGGKKKKGKRK